MTFDQIVDTVAKRLNLTSDTAYTRIGVSVNERYGWLCTSMGLQTAVQEVATAMTEVGSNLVTFGPSPIKVQKVDSVFNPAYPKPNTLTELTLGMLRNLIFTTQPAQHYAVYRMGSDRVTIMLDSTTTSAYQLNADVIADKAQLNGSDVPTFANAYHDVLIYGAMATELDKMEKPDLAQVQENRFDQRLSELRLFIAKSAYKDIYQGRTGPGVLSVNRLV
jgi:hypothetical protein